MKCLPALGFFLLMIFAPVGLSQSQPALRVNAEANQSYLTGRYRDALLKFEQALKLATDADDKQYQAIAMYGLARTNGHLCNVTESEKWFRNSIALRETLPDDKYARLTQNLIEFSRFLIAQKRLLDAVPYMERAVPNLESLGAEQSDPIAYAEFLDIYENALRTADRASDAEKALSRAKELRAKYPGRTAKFKPEVYPTNC